MLSTINNVRIALAPYWRVFSKYRGEECSPTAWVGPAQPDHPPYDIMCPTPPRPREEEERLTELVRELVRTTNLAVPRIRLAVCKNIGYRAEGATVSDTPAELVFNKDALAAVVVGDTNIEELIEESKAKVLCVSFNNIKLPKCSPSRLLHITIEDTDDKVSVTDNNNQDVITADNLITVTHNVRQNHLYNLIILLLPGFAPHGLQFLPRYCYNQVSRSLCCLLA